MWSYYGAKTNIVHWYPKPKHNKIIEPFAGTARYALKYYDHEVLLVDKYEVIVRIWKWLQQCSPNDILKLPRKLHKGMSLDDYTFDCVEAKWLMGFLVSKAVESPRIRVTDWVAIDRPNFANYLIKKISANLFKIKHWEIIHGCYSEIPNQTATWFIDPPYQVGGTAYKFSSKKINFPELGNWCRERSGQVIVCESANANWLDFKPMISEHKGRTGMQREGIWTNEHSLYDNEQQQLFKRA